MKSFDKTQDRKILIFSIAYVPFVGGAELAIKEIADRINDFHFDLITLRFNNQWPAAEKIGNVIVYRVGGPKFLFPFTALLKGLSLHKKYKHQIIWSMMANRAGFAALFFKIFHPDVKFLLTLQEGDTLDYPERRMGIFRLFLKPLFKSIFKRANYIQTISSYLAVWARNMGFKGRLEIVPNGVDIAKFQTPNSKFQTRELKDKLDIKDNEKILITTSRLVKKNAIGDVIEAMRYLPENVKFLILGSGPLEHELKLQTTNYKLQTRVIFLGHIEPEEAPKYLAISDIFVRPSLSEGLGSSFLEAMAAGIPVIATKVGGIPDFLKDPSTDSGQATGLFCEVNNPKSIAEKVKILLENGELRGKIIANAKKMIEENYDWNLIADKMKNIFDKLS